jgi:hypothetical protein
MLLWVLSMWVTTVIPQNYYITPVDNLYVETQAIYETYLSNPKNYSIWFEWYDYNSREMGMVNYWYDNTDWDEDMITTFFGESKFDPNALWALGEQWFCQLMSNWTNNVWLNDTRRDNVMRQAKICMEKWEAVSEINKWKIRFAYWQKWMYSEKIKKLKKRK